METCHVLLFFLTRCELESSRGTSFTCGGDHRSRPSLGERDRRTDPCRLPHHRAVREQQVRGHYHPGVKTAPVFWWATAFDERHRAI